MSARTLYPVPQMFGYFLFPSTPLIKWWQISLEKEWQNHYHRYPLQCFRFVPPGNPISPLVNRFTVWKTAAGVKTEQEVMALHWGSSWWSVFGFFDHPSRDWPIPLLADVVFLSILSTDCPLWVRQEAAIPTSPSITMIAPTSLRKVESCPSGTIILTARESCCCQRVQFCIGISYHWLSL